MKEKKKSFMKLLSVCKDSPRASLADLKTNTVFQADIELSLRKKERKLFVT